MRTCQQTHARQTDIRHAHGMHRCHCARQLKHGIGPQARASISGRSRAGGLDNCNQLPAQHPRALLRRGRGGTRSARGPGSAANSAACARSGSSRALELVDFLLRSRAGHLPKRDRSDHRRVGHRAEKAGRCQASKRLTKQVACWARG